VKRAGLLAYPPVDTLAQEIRVPDMARILFGWLTDPRRVLGPVLILTSLAGLGASRMRWLLLIGSVLVGLVLALLTYHLRARWGSWGGNTL
jgi:hypothetical protein